MECVRRVCNRPREGDWPDGDRRMEREGSVSRVCVCEECSTLERRETPSAVMF